MPICEKEHIIRDKQDRFVKRLEHEYIAGICITMMTPQTLAFLEYTYPLYRSINYERSHYPINKLEGD